MAYLKRKTHMTCVFCNGEYEGNLWLFNCPRCGGLLEVQIELEPRVSWSRLKGRPWNMWRYRELLPAPDSCDPVTLGEGGTPLIRLGRVLGDGGVRGYVKFEGANPTGSFKDRGMSLAATLARLARITRVIVASTGNTAASAAAYSARADIECVVVLPKGKVARGKLFQAILHGARIAEVNGNFDEALKLVMKASREGLVYPLNSFNPWRLEGQKTVAYEIVEELGQPPDWIVVPVGNAGNISAIWKGLKELESLGLIREAPRLVGVQAEGASPLAEAWERGLQPPPKVENPETVASAIRIGDPVNWPKAIRAVKESDGTIVKVSDAEILRAQHDLARLEGVACEPAGAASTAGARRLIEEGVIDRGETVVVVATGHALKDPDSPLPPASTLSLSEIVKG